MLFWGVFRILIPNDLQFNYQKLKSNIRKYCSKYKNEKSRAWERNENRAKKEMKTEFLFLFHYYFQIMN